MRKTILLGGKAGQGSAVTSHLIGKIFCRLGYFVFNYRDYPSLIRGGHNFNILEVSDSPVYSQGDSYDIILAFDQKTVDLHEKNLKEGGFVLGSDKLKSEKLQAIAIDDILKKLGGPKILENDVLIGSLFKYFGVDKEFLFEEAKREFGEKADLIIKAIAEGWELVKESEKIKKQEKKNYFISGNEGVSVGALAAGIDAYFAYPMTPATAVLHYLSKKSEEYNVIVSQLENEIAVANAAVGAAFSGTKVMVGTSGGGFALMTEAVSLAGISELPVVFYLAQRTGPATGVPTYTSQGDLKIALNAGQGEFPRIVLAPGDAKEAIIRTKEAFYLAWKYRNPVIILGDKHLGESDYSFRELENSPVSKERFILNNPSEDYKSYQITETGVSPVAVPGQGPFVRGTSYEHDEYGNTTEEPDMIIKMSDKRMKKTKEIEKEVKKLNPAAVYGKGKNLIVGWGSTKGAIIDSLAGLKDYRFLQVSYLSPFPKDIIKKEIEKSENVVLVENNVTGLLGKVIMEETGLEIKNRVLKYDGRPFSAKFIINKIKNG
ncbi:MAG: 2-oxoacid:acceptor oxidoreductase subunit alpha [Candidatus Nealsonbacteria bacterium]